MSKLTKLIDWTLLVYIIPYSLYNCYYYALTYAMAAIRICVLALQSHSASIHLEKDELLCMRPVKKENCECKVGSSVV